MLSWIFIVVRETHLNDLIEAIQMGKNILDKADKQSLINNFLVLNKKTTDLVSSFDISSLFFSRENQTNNERSDVPLTEDEFNQDYNLSNGVYIYAKPRHQQDSNSHIYICKIQN
jgi:hypothetical protein